MMWMAAAAAAPNGPTLDEARWTHRLIVLVAHDAEHPRVNASRAVFGSRPDAVDDRKLRLVTVLGGANAEVDGLSATPHALVEAWSIAPDTPFEALLVGLDGGVKARTHDAVDLDAWFARIDAMPMRVRELKGRTGG